MTKEEADKAIADIFNDAKKEMAEKQKGAFQKVLDALKELDIEQLADFELTSYFEICNIETQRALDEIHTRHLL